MLKDDENRKKVLQIMCHYRGVPSSIQSHNQKNRTTSYVLSKPSKVAPKVEKTEKENTTNRPALRPKTAGPYRNVKNGATKKYESQNQGTSKYYHGETQTLVAVKSPYASTYNYKLVRKNELFA
jgi:hypothetical protein